MKKVFLVSFESLLKISTFHKKVNFLLKVNCGLQFQQTHVLRVFNYLFLCLVVRLLVCFCHQVALGTGLLSWQKVNIGVLLVLPPTSSCGRNNYQSKKVHQEIQRKIEPPLVAGIIIKKKFTKKSKQSQRNPTSPCGRNDYQQN